MIARKDRLPVRSPPRAPASGSASRSAWAGEWSLSRSFHRLQAGSELAMSISPLRHGQHPSWRPAAHGLFHSQHID